MDRFVDAGSRARTARGAPIAVGNVGGFGNLVVLINPAFEATLYSALNDMVAGRGYLCSQRPVFAVLTSETDQATRVAFPIGRFFSN